MTEKGILVLNTIGFFLETALGIWIFSQAFPRRKEVVWEWRLILDEALLHGLLLFIIFLNFFRRLNVPAKFLLSLHIPQELRIRSRGTERHSASN